MKSAGNILVSLVGLLIVVTGFVWEKVEERLEGTFFGYIFDGVMLAALFFGFMGLLKWAVWVMR